MDLLFALVSQIKNTAAITTYTSNRIYPLYAPQRARTPYIIYRQVSNVPIHTMTNDPKIKSYRIQLSMRSTSFTTVCGLSTQVKTALRDKTGTLGTSNFTVQRIFFDNEYDFPDLDPETERVLCHRAQDYIVWTTG